MAIPNHHRRPPSLLRTSLPWVVCLFILCALPVASLSTGEDDLAAPSNEASSNSRERAAGNSVPTDDFVHASLPTDPSLQSLYERARRFAHNKKYDMAVQQLRTILQHGPRNLIRTGPRQYLPARKVAEDVLLSLPREALQSYQLAVESAASALFEKAVSEKSITLLNRVVIRYFLSSYGDDAAYQLACHHIDREEWRPALRLLTLLLTRHPNPSISRHKCRTRLVYVAHRLGDQRTVETQLQKLRTLFPERPLPPHMRSIVKTPGIKPPYEETSDSDAMQPALFTSQSKRDQPFLVNIWRKSVQPEARKTDTPAFLKELWSENNFRPTDHILAHKGLVWVSSPGGIICLQSDNGEVQWQRSGTSPFHLGDKHPRSVFVGFTPVRYKWAEKLYFQDRINGSMSRIGDNVYRIEGNWQTVPQNKSNRGQEKASPESLSRTSSRLVAYEAATGDIQWILGNEKEYSRCRFMGPPVNAGSHLLAVLEHSDGMDLLAIEPADGDVIWRKSLCSYVRSPIPPTRPVGITLDRGQAYIATGKGVVFCVDAFSGMIQWAAVYDGKITRWRGPRILDLRNTNDDASSEESWHENTVNIVGNKCLVLPSDAGRLLCFDRESGKLRYDRQSNEAKYFAGINELGLFATGPQTLQNFSIDTGQLEWESPIPQVTGRVKILQNHIYVPEVGSIRKISTSTGKTEHVYRVSHAQSTPIGNITIHNGQVYAASLGMVSGFSSGENILRNLTEKVESETSPSAYLQRGLFLRQTGRFQRARSDLRKAYEEFCKDSGTKSQDHTGPVPDQDKCDRARKALLKTFLDYANEKPNSATEHISEARRLAQTTHERRLVQQTDAEIASRKGEKSKAIRKYLDLVSNPDSSLLPFRPHNKTHRIALPQWVRKRIHKVLVSADEKEQERLKDVLIQYCEDLRRKAKPQEWEKMYRIAWAIPTGPQATKVAIDASHLALRANRAAQAELILKIFRQLSEPEEAARVQYALAELYLNESEYSRAHAMYERLSSVTSAQKINNMAIKAKRKLEKEHGETLRPRSLPGPPFKLAWQKSVPGMPLRRHTQHAYNISQFDTAAYFLGENHKTLISRLLRSGEISWETPLSDHESLYIDTNILYLLSPTPRAISLRTGQYLWDNQRRSSSQEKAKIRFTETPGAILQTTELHAGGFRVSALDTVTGRIRWERILTQRYAPHFAKLGAYILDMSGIGHGDSMSVYSALTGERVESNLNISLNQQFWSDRGFVTQEGKKLVFRKLPHGDRDWTIPLESRSQGRLGPVKHSPAGYYIDSEKIAIIDPSRRRIIWQMQFPNDGTDFSQNVSARFNPRLQEYLLMFSSASGNQSKWLFFINAQTGELVNKIQLPTGCRPARSKGYIANSKFILVRQHKDDRPEKQKNRSLRLLGRNDGDLLPADTFPSPLPDQSGEARSRQSFRIWTTDHYVLIHSGTELRVYRGGSANP